jgi:hypothetical protein
MNGFQNASGFYTLAAHESGGWEPWHATGDASAAMHILGARPARRNTLYDTIASEPALWEKTFRPLLEPRPLPNPAGCDHFHQCAHKLVAIRAANSGGCTGGGGGCRPPLAPRLHRIPTHFPLNLYGV